MKLGWRKHDDEGAAPEGAAPSLDFTAFESEIGLGLSDSARIVLEAAAAEARSSNHAEIGAEHLLVAVIDRGGAVSALLAEHGLTLEAARGQVAEALWEESPDGTQPLQLNEEARGVIKVAVESAESRQATTLEPEHIAYGVASAGFEITSRVLHNLHVDRAKLVTELEKRLDS